MDWRDEDPGGDRISGRPGPDATRDGTEDGADRDRTDPAGGGGSDDGQRDRDAVVVYDGDCPFCDAVASALRRLPDAGAVQWDAELAQAFLSAQFDDPPFAMVFVDADEGRVYAGRAAAREVCERAGMPVLLGDVVGDNYERLSDAVRSVAGLDRDPDPYHEGYPLADEARERVPALAAAARNPGADHLDR